MQRRTFPTINNFNEIIRIKFQLIIITKTLIARLLHKKGYLVGDSLISINFVRLVI